MRQAAIAKCNCIPWNIPKQKTKNFELCDNTNNCFDRFLSSNSPAECNCSPDCNGTFYTVFQTRTPMALDTCTKESTKWKPYPHKALCSICYKLFKNFRTRFIYDFVVNKGPDPRLVDLFCDKFLVENLATVKVEMATKSITRSVRDIRFDFVGQLSSLGQYLLFSVLINRQWLLHSFIFHNFGFFMVSDCFYFIYRQSLVKTPS